MKSSPLSALQAQFADSAKSLRRTQTIALTGLLLAVQMALSSYGSLRLSESLWISLGHLALAPTAMLFGPVVAAAQAALSDILSFLIRPSGPYFPGFTLSALLSGLIYGVALYKTRASVWQIALSRAAIVLLLNILLNTAFLAMLYGPAQWAAMPARALRSCLQFPVDCLLLAVVLRIVRRIPMQPGAR